MAEEEKKGIGEQQIVVFSLGSEEFGVDIDQVREIIKLEDITKIPNTENYIDGVINLRGKIVVIIDLEKKLSLTTKERDKDTRIIVIEVDGNSIGMVVDSCNEVLRLPEDKIESAPEIITQKINADYVEGVGVLEERLIILLNLSKVLGDHGMKKVAEISIKHQAKE